jgi:6-pyruvoyltetrahydropterin/6-carboxytetrahydropterin synthase
MLVSKTFTYCWGHRLINYVGPCAQLHGHTWQIIVQLHGKVDLITGMVEDFNDLKTKVGPIVSEFDHLLVLSKKDKLVPILQAAGEKIAVVDFNPTSENFAVYFYNKIKDIYKDNHRIQEINVIVSEGPTSYAAIDHLPKNL